MIDEVTEVGTLSFILISYYLVAPAALYFAFRLARPLSWWAARFYDDERLVESRQRYCGGDSFFMTAMELKRRLEEGMPGWLWGYDPVQVDQYLQDAFETVHALEGSRPEAVTVPVDLMNRPDFKLAWGGYQRTVARAVTTDFGESIIGHKLLHSPG